MRRQTAAFLVAVLFSLIVATAYADVPLPAPVVDDRTRNQVLNMLSGIEHFPGPDKWKALNADGIKVLRWVAMDPTHWPIRRARAVIALGHIGGEESRELLVQVLALNDRIAPMLKRHAMSALAHGWGERAIDWIQPHLADSDFFVREAAVRSLAAIGTARAFELIRERKAVEPEAALRKTITQALESAGAK